MIVQGWLYTLLLKLSFDPIFGDTVCWCLQGITLFMNCIVIMILSECCMIYFVKSMKFLFNKEFLISNVDITKFDLFKSSEHIF